MGVQYRKDSIKELKNKPTIPKLAESVKESKETESLILELAADHEARLCEIELGV